MPTDTIWIPPPSPKDQKQLKKRRKHQGQRLIKWLGLSEKTLWDWLQLLAALAVPVAIAIGTTWFSAEQSQASEQASEKQHQTDIQIANDQQQETALQTYLDRMSDLLLNNKLRESQPGDEVRNVARARTITVLPQLNNIRKREILQFLYETHLIGFHNFTIDMPSIIDLSGANLSGIDLSNANLSGIDLSGANLNDTNLHTANLSYAKLNEAELNRTDMIFANLNHTQMVSTYLSHANLHATFLNETDMSGADLSGADLTQAHLKDADLTQAYLHGTNLTKAHMEGVDLSNADLSGARLSRAFLDGAFLNGTQYNTEMMQDEDDQGNPIILQPTQWPKGFDPKAHGAICVDCKK